MSSVDSSATIQMSLDGPRILVVDDDARAAEDLARILARIVPCHADSTADATEAIRHVGEYQVVVTDLIMPDRDGLALLAEIKAIAPSCEVIVITVAPQISTAVAAMRLGAVDYLKHDSGDEWLVGLASSVRHSLRRRSSLRSPGYHREHVLEFFFDRIAPRIRKDAAGQFPPGVALEYLVKLLLDSCKGFDASKMRHRTLDEEIDVICINSSRHPFWAKQGPIIVVECKDRERTRPGANERSRLEEKIRNREGRATAGLFVSTSGFASTFGARRTATPVPGGPPPLIVPIGTDDLRDWIDAFDRADWLCGKAIAVALK